MTDNNGDCALTLTQASDFMHGRVSEEAVRRALASGELRGRNLGGNVGWMTTKAAVLEWIKRGNVGKANVRSKTQGGSDGTTTSD